STTPEATPENGIASHKTESAAGQQAEEHQGDMPHGTCEDSSQENTGESSTTELSDPEVVEADGSQAMDVQRIGSNESTAPAEKPKEKVQKAKPDEVAIMQLLNNQKKHLQAFLGFGRKSVEAA